MTTTWEYTRIDLEDVSFGYGSERQELAVRNLSLHIRPGEKVAIVGNNGCGKTTLLRLLLGLYRPFSGEIQIDSIPLGSLDLRAYRRQIGVVLQDNFLMTGTILENIAAGDRSPDRERTLEAARKARILDFLPELPNGLDTSVGERGLCLSGGQRQRIAIARVLYRNPSLVLLDEATSSLDATSEQLLESELSNILPQTTAIIVTHKLSLAQKADRIVDLQVAEGPEEALTKPLET